MGANLAKYMYAAGMNPFLVIYIQVFMNVGTNVYIGVPLMHSQFGEWLKVRGNGRWIGRSPVIAFQDYKYDLQYYWHLLIEGLKMLDTGLPPKIRYIVVCFFFSVHIIIGMSKLSF